MMSLIQRVTIGSIMLWLNFGRLTSLEVNFNFRWKPLTIICLVSVSEDHSADPSLDLFVNACFVKLYIF